MGFKLTIGKKSFGFSRGGFTISTDPSENKQGFVVHDADLRRILGALDCEYTDHNLITLFHSVPEIYAPINEVASRVSSGNFQVKKLSTKEVVTNNKDLNKLLSAPNPLRSFQELIYEWCAYEMVVGRNFLFHNIPDTLSFDYKNVAALWNLWADQVTIVTDPLIKYLSATDISDIIKGYRMNYGTELSLIPTEKVLYTSHLSLEPSPYKLYGKSPLLSAKKAVANLVAVYEARGAIYLKRGAVGIVVSKKSDDSGLVPLTPAEKKQLRSEYQESYGITGNKSPIAITNLPVDFIKVGMSIQELQPFEETKADAASIYAVYGVPRDLMPSNEGSTFENQNTAEKRLYRNICIPKAQKIAQLLTTYWRLNEVGLYIDVNFDHVEVLQENKKEKSDVDWRNNETSRVRFINGVITLNNWRTAAGFESSTNPIYDKLIYELSPEELALVKEILSIKSNGGGKSSSGSDQSQNNDTGATEAQN